MAAWRHGCAGGLPRAPAAEPGHRRGQRACGCAPPAGDAPSPPGVDGSALPRPVADNGPPGVRVLSPDDLPGALPPPFSRRVPGNRLGSVIHGQPEHTPHAPSGRARQLPLKPRHRRRWRWLGHRHGAVRGQRAPRSRRPVPPC
ncbi:hypothetical protein QJS66_16370 [Kocuria rhizophila]|nr:hypothetical protein QJS66_16370 [Kocuria rhizophila]